MVTCLGGHQGGCAFLGPSALLVTRPLFGAQNQEAHIIGEPLASELSQIALERSEGVLRSES